VSEALALCYHAISDDWPCDLAVTSDRFGEQLKSLLGRGYEAVTFSQLADSTRPRKAVAITFDDAFLSVYEDALPTLRELGMVATIFVPTDYPDSNRLMAWPGLDAWEGLGHGTALRSMSWDQLRDVRELGWEVGSHTCSHPRLTSLDDESLARELRRSRQICSEQLGDCHSLAYPYGDWDARVATSAREAGYRIAGALSGRWHRNVTLSYPRIGVYRGDDARRFALKVSPATRRARSLRAWGWIERGRARRR